MELIAKNKGLILRLALTLFIVGAAAALILSGTHALTDERIRMNDRLKITAAMEELWPGGEFSESPVYESAEASVYSAKQNGGSPGYCVLVAPEGFRAAIGMMVGVGPKGAVTGIRILSASETAGLGTKALDADFLTRFEGAEGNVSIGGGEGRVAAVTGATITSKAVAAGVNQALTAVKDYELGGAAS